MKLLGKDIKLAIFDLDGTLIASTSIWSDIDRIFFSRRGMDIPPTYGAEIAHVGLHKAAIITKEKCFPNESVEDIEKEWLNLSYEEYKNTIPLKSHAKELLDYLYKNNVIIALATANSKDIYDVCLDRLDIKKYFSYIIDVNSCKEGKNSSEIYDKVAEKYNVKKEETFIFEDMLVPLITAYNAGYNTISIYDNESTKDIEAVKKHSLLLIKDFDEIISLFNKENR